jgi:hypothetical protein
MLYGQSQETHRWVEPPMFKSNSQLTRIQSEIILFSSLQSILIPRNVRFIDGSAFIDVTLSSITIESANEIFVIENEFLIDVVYHKWIRHLSKSLIEKLAGIWKFLNHVGFHIVNHFHPFYLNQLYD